METRFKRKDKHDFLQDAFILCTSYKEHTNDWLYHVGWCYGSSMSCFCRQPDVPLWYGELFVLCSLCHVHFISGEQCGSHTAASCLGMDVVIVRLNIESAGLGRLGIDFWLQVQLRVYRVHLSGVAPLWLLLVYIGKQVNGNPPVSRNYPLHFRSYSSPHRSIFLFSGWHWSA